MIRSLYAVLAAILASLAAAGCGSSSYARLASENDIGQLAILKREAATRPNHTVMVPTAAAAGRPVRIAIHQIDNPQTDQLIVLIHGVFADHKTWRFLAADLGRDHDLWLIDLPGCGDSDKPDPSDLGPDGYSPGAMAGRVLEAMRSELAKRPGNPPITLGAHSLGGAVTIRMFANESLHASYADVLGRIDRLVLIAPVDVALNKQDPMFHEIATASGFKIGLGSTLGVLREKVAAATLDSVCDPRHALREEADKRLEVLTDGPQRRAMQAMVIQTTSWRNSRPDWDTIEPVVASYARVTPATLIIWGMRDETLPCSMGYKLARELPHAEMLCLPRVMHSPHLEEPVLTARLIREFIETGKSPTLPHYSPGH
jgi:pimeloyl-ACP methyl ester carboxylesterase